MKVFEYVGPPEIARAALGAPRGKAIASPSELAAWFAAHDDDRAGDRVWATYVVDDSGVLRIAPRRSEHVACAGGAPVRCAGELSIDARGAIFDLTNHSTGYCPDITSWVGVEEALRRIGANYPRDGFTFAAVFRRCIACGERNLVKDDWFVCAICDAPLPAEWNFDAI